MAISFVDLDVRPILRAGGEPLENIMNAVAGLGPNEGLRLVAPFKPQPLFQVLGSKGFSHEAKEIGGGEWEVLFRPTDLASPSEIHPGVLPADNSVWSDPVRQLDNRELDPPEPMVRVLAAVEEMKEGEVLTALLCREPMFLLAELAKRGHQWRGGFEPDGKSYKIIVKVGAPQGGAV